MVIKFLFSFLSLGDISNQDLSLQHKQPGDVKKRLNRDCFQFFLGKIWGTYNVCYKVISFHKWVA